MHWTKLCLLMPVFPFALTLLNLFSLYMCWNSCCGLQWRTQLRWFCRTTTDSCPPANPIHCCRPAWALYSQGCMGSGLCSLCPAWPKSPGDSRCPKRSFVFKLPVFPPPSQVTPAEWLSEDRRPEYDLHINDNFAYFWSIVFHARKTFLEKEDAVSLWLCCMEKCSSFCFAWEGCGLYYIVYDYIFWYNGADFSTRYKTLFILPVTVNVTSSVTCDL